MEMKWRTGLDLQQLRFVYWWGSATVSLSLPLQHCIINIVHAVTIKFLKYVSWVYLAMSHYRFLRKY